VAAVQAGPVAPAPVPAPAPGNTHVASTSPNTQNTASGYKYCYCIDGQNNDVNTATNNVYQGYIQAGSFDKDVVQLNYSGGAATATVSYSAFFATSSFLFTLPSFFPPLLSNILFVTSAKMIRLGMAMILKPNVSKIMPCQPSAGTKAV
jgi:hypothetical protein